MKLIFCVDEQGGLAFNHRRQSQDRAVRDDILQLCGDTKLWVTAYTARQFDAAQQTKLMISEMCFEAAAPDDFCFIEDLKAEINISYASQIILYHWNRRYPSDQKLILPLQGWRCTACTEFAGYSHEKITKEVYIR